MLQKVLGLDLESCTPIDTILHQFKSLPAILCANPAANKERWIFQNTVVMVNPILIFCSVLRMKAPNSHKLSRSFCETHVQIIWNFSWGKSLNILGFTWGEEWLHIPGRTPGTVSKSGIWSWLVKCSQPEMPWLLQTVRATAFQHASVYFFRMEYFHVVYVMEVLLIWNKESCIV